MHMHMLHVHVHVHVRLSVAVDPSSILVSVHTSAMCTMHPSAMHPLATHPFTHRRIHSCIHSSMHPCIWLQADTPEAMLREMLEMSNLELQLRSQLAEEAEGRYQRTISEQQAIRRGGSL